MGFSRNIPYPPCWGYWISRGGVGIKDIRGYPGGGAPYKSISGYPGGVRKISRGRMTQKRDILNRRSTDFFWKSPMTDCTTATNIPSATNICYYVKFIFLNVFSSCDNDAYLRKWWACLGYQWKWNVCYWLWNGKKTFFSFPDEDLFLFFDTFHNVKIR